MPPSMRWFSWPQAAAIALLATIGCSSSSVPIEPLPPFQGVSAILDPGGKAAGVGAMRQSVTLSLAVSEGRPAIAARGRVTNAGTQPLHLEYGACSLQLLAYRSPDRSGAPAWNSDQRKAWPGGASYGCALYLAMRDLSPGATMEPPEFVLSVPLVEVLGDSLPDGRYYFAAQLRMNLNVATLLDAGTADLALERPAPPALHVVESLTR